METPENRAGEALYVKLLEKAVVIAASQDEQTRILLAQRLSDARLVLDQKVASGMEGAFAPQSVSLAVFRINELVRQISETHAKKAN